MSSRVVLECTFSNDKKKKDKKLKESKKITQNLTLNKIGNKELAKLIEENIPKNNERSNDTKIKDTTESCEYEMKMIFIASSQCEDEKINETRDLE
jgi:glycine cleavage system pyridoxal-binding protein P